MRWITQPVNRGFELRPLHFPVRADQFDRPGDTMQEI
jgi:hypothetical protein